MANLEAATSRVAWVNNLTDFQPLVSTSTQSLPSVTPVYSRQSREHTAALISVCFPSLQQTIVRDAVDNVMSNAHPPNAPAISSGSNSGSLHEVTRNDGTVALLGPAPTMISPSVEAQDEGPAFNYWTSPPGATSQPTDMGLV